MPENHPSEHRTLIIGSKGGLGTALTQDLRNKGRTLVELSRTEIDLEDPKSVTDMAKSIRHINFDAVVINAAKNNPIPLTNDYAMSEIASHLQVNFLAHTELLLSVLPRMIDQGFGRIVAISSLYAERARPGRAPYSVSKACLETIIKSIAIEHSRSNVLANVIRPGFLDTNLTRKNNSEKQIEEIVSNVPVGRLGKVNEVVDLIDFLISEKNMFITGEVITVDGGFQLR
jgi:NAD(P)-dependent dehydrogenase (short-subunit alcohol dehydrogenase family)